MLMKLVPASAAERMMLADARGQVFVQRLVRLREGRLGSAVVIGGLGADGAGAGVVFFENVG